MRHPTYHLCESPCRCWHVQVRKACQIPSTTICLQTFVCKTSPSDPTRCVVSTGPPMRSSTGLSPLGLQNRQLFCKTRDTQAPGGQYVVPTAKRRNKTQTTHNKKTTSKVRNVCNEIHLPKPLFLVCVGFGWLVWFFSTERT